MIKNLTHEIGRGTALKMLLLLNKVNEGLVQLKLEIEYIADSEVTPEFVERVEQDAGRAIAAINRKYKADVCRYEEHVFSVAEAEIKSDAK